MTLFGDPIFAKAHAAAAKSEAITWSTVTGRAMCDHCMLDLANDQRDTAPHRGTQRRKQGVNVLDLCRAHAQDQRDQDGTA